MHVHVCLETVMFCWSFNPESPLWVLSSWNELTQLQHECGVRQGCSHCQCSPSPRSLKSAAAPPAPGWPWLEFLPLQGAEQLRMSIPLEGGKEAAGHWLHKPTRCRLGLVPRAWRAHILFSVSVSKAEPDWLQSCIESSLLPTPGAQWAFTKEQTCPEIAVCLLKLCPHHQRWQQHPTSCFCQGRPRGTSLPGTSSVCCTSAPGHGGRHWFVPPLSWTSTPRVSVKWKILSCTLIYLEKDMSLNIDSFCNETNTFQTAAGLSYPLKYSCGGVTWNMFPSEILFSFDVCSNACAILSVRLLQTVTCAIYFYNGTSYCWTFKMFFYKQTNKYWESPAWNKENRSWGKTIFIVLGLWNTLQRSDFSV